MLKMPMPILFFEADWLLQGLLAVLLIVMTVLTWVFTSTNVQHSVRSVAAEFRHELLLRVEDTMEATLQRSNASSVSLAKYLSSLSQVTQASFVSLEDQVFFASFSFVIIAARHSVPILCCLYQLVLTQCFFLFLCR